MDSKRIGELLRKLPPKQEKVVRMHYGLGCERPHSAAAIAQEFGISLQAIAGILGVAQRRLARERLTASHLREAARQEAEKRGA
jgi:RNA polymerase primary sigma factor